MTGPIVHESSSAAARSSVDLLANDAIARLPDLSASLKSELHIGHQRLLLALLATDDGWDNCECEGYANYLPAFRVYNFPPSKPNASIPKWVPQLVDRDGGPWCSYCGVYLATSLDDFYWDYGEIHDGCCHCGEHGIENADPCIQFPRWSTEHEHAYKDHVVPRSRGGINDLSNLVLCCVHCNSSKGPRMLDEWKQKPEYRRRMRYAS